MDTGAGHCGNRRAMLARDKCHDDGRDHKDHGQCACACDTGARLSDASREGSADPGWTGSNSLPRHHMCPAGRISVYLARLSQLYRMKEKHHDLAREYFA
jgi:hypothetical protein